MNYNYEEKMFFEYFIRKYYKHAKYATNLYKDKLSKYKSLDEFHNNAIKDANDIVLKYIDIAIEDLNTLSMDNISSRYFFKNYYDKEKYYVFKEDLEKVKLSYEDLLSYEEEVKRTISEFNSKKYNSNLKIYPKNLASIPTALGLNIAASIISGASRTISNKKDIDDLKNDILKQKNYVLEQIQNSNILISSFFKSIFNISKSFFDCIEDYLGYEVYKNFTGDISNILNSPNDEKSIQSCINKFKKDALNRHDIMDKTVASSFDIVYLALDVVKENPSICIIAFVLLLLMIFVSFL